MLDFFSLYGSFEEFYETFFRGNEVEFIYRGQQYYILPIWNASKTVTGVYFGKAYGENEIQCFSKEELYNVRIEDSTLGNILKEIKIKFYAF